MYGVVFEMEVNTENIVVYASFGGLLMRVIGTHDGMQNFRKEGKDARIIIMLKRA
jgi:hypothetical protein